MAKLDFELVKSAALDRAEEVCSSWAPNGKRQGPEWVALNPTRSDNSARSFSVNLATGLWSDFATDDTGGDLISLVAYIDRVSQGEACKKLASFLGVQPGTEQPTPPAKSKPQKPAFEPYYPPPPDAAKSCPKRHYKLGEASTYWDYLSESGALLMRVARFDRTRTNGERAKEYRPCNYGRNKGYTKWHWLQLPDNRPLYGLETLGSFKADVPVLLTEGEKAADAARLLFPHHPCLTWSGGSKAIGKTDFKPLAGRAVWYWPDNDEAGEKSVSAIRGALEAVGVGALHVLDLGIFKRCVPDSSGKPKESADARWPEKADAADAVEFGWKAEHFSALAASGSLLKGADVPASENASAPTDTEAQSNQPAFGYRVNDGGVYWFDPKAEKQRRICARLDVLARSRDGNGSGRNWGLLVRFSDFDGVEKQWNIPMRLFATEGGADVVRGLFDRGLDIDSHREARRKVLDYLQGTEPTERVALAYKMGWHRGAFVLPERTLGETREPVLYYSEGEPLCKLTERGTLEGWQENVSRYCAGNPLAVFAVSAALSSPMVELLGYETMGYHFFGDSSWGKSTLLNIACSLYGKPDDYKCTWRSTDNALEAQAAAHSDLLLALDEINQVDPRIIGDVVYMLGNGQGKHRANDRGQGGGNQHRWRLTFLSNGEKTLEQYLAESGKAQTGGMEMRFIGLRSTFQESEEGRKKYGIFNEVHGFSGGAELSEYLRDAMAENHGTAFPAFLEALLKNVAGDKRANFAEKLLGKIGEFKRAHLSGNAGGQVTRAASKFALVGWAGELATKWGVTGWPPGEALRAADACFKSWLETRGGEGNLEDRQMLDHVRQQLSKYSESRFKRWDADHDSKNAVVDSHQPITAEAWGYRREEVDPDALEGDSSDVVFYVFTQAFQRDICKGWDANRIARLLRDIDALELRDSERREGRLATKERLPRMGKKPVQVYKIRMSALYGSESREQAEAA
ncbi:DUF927 domain-containing protein [Marinimicrobium sp. ABcell2]|uniref:DUF927 domain-containing protein n=1 Tax=Marinimicrobium sp. ABcell2 TaxID=3069751 RepID=UPI0027B7C394|nr:DUF927 domain-containing protein [Marinimicrobium sp. ABcell2]MDQ2076079.1 DUF927 domain-containing protein [Marinimicrobium sp. ABcell2]